MPRRTITADATGRVTAEPTQATVELTIRGEADAPRVARERARDHATTVRAALTDGPVPTEEVRATDRQVESTEELFETDPDVPYRATEELAVDCDPGTADEVVVTATDAGASIRRVGFGVHEETRDALQDEALDAAMANARRKAERIAAAEDLTLAGVREVTTREVSTGMESIVDDAIGNTPDGNFQPDPVEVNEAVEVVYDVDEE